VYDYANGTNTETGSLNTGRYVHTATLLPNGNVLVAGGYSGSSYVSSAELFDPTAGTWTNTSSLNIARDNHTATLLPDGKVLVAGGYSDNGGYLNSAELYDPYSGTWKLITALTTDRMYPTATLLSNGKVLVAGGGNSSGALSSAELYDPVTETWIVTGSMTFPRGGHTATLLMDGNVLVAGGYNGSLISTAELYDPVTGIWTPVPSMARSRYGHTATLLPNGKVLLTGGAYDTLAELFDPTTRQWIVTGSMTSPRHWPTATLLNNGKVLVAGGYNGPVDLASAELYDPATGLWTLTGAMAAGRLSHSATALLDGKVLIAGGSGDAARSSAELYDVGLGYTNSWRPQIVIVTSPLNLGGNLVVTGSQFRGIGEGSSGSSQDSSADYPLVQLRRLDNEQTTFLLTTNWSTNSFTSLPVWNFPPGYALATVFVNGIQSTSSVVNISVPVPTAATLTGTQKLTNGFRFAFTNSVGVLFGVLATTNLTLPSTNWTALGGVVETSPGQFQFTDLQATDGGQHFYRAYAP
jgi:N-acetylneuraminic acid mutarotase